MELLAGLLGLLWAVMVVAYLSQIRNSLREQTEYLKQQVALLEWLTKNEYGKPREQSPPQFR